MVACGNTTLIKVGTNDCKVIASEALIAHGLDMEVLAQCRKSQECLVEWIKAGEK